MKKIWSKNIETCGTKVSKYDDLENEISADNGIGSDSGETVQAVFWNCFSAIVITFWRWGSTNARIWRAWLGKLLRNGNKTSGWLHGRWLERCADGGSELAVGGVRPGSRPSRTVASGYPGVVESHQTLSESSEVARKVCCGSNRFCVFSAADGDAVTLEWKSEKILDKNLC